MVMRALALKIACRLFCIHAQLMQMVQLNHVVLGVVTTRRVELRCATDRRERRLPSVAHLVELTRKLRERDEKTEVQ